MYLILFTPNQQSHSLKSVSTGIRSGLLFHTAAVYGRLNTPDDEFNTMLLNQFVTKFYRLRKVMRCINMHQRKGDFAGVECLECQVEHTDRIHPPRKKKSWPFKFGSYFSHDEDPFIFQLFQLILSFNYCHKIILYDA